MKNNGQIIENLSYFWDLQHRPSEMAYSKQDFKNLVVNGHTAAVLAATVAVGTELRDTGALHRSAMLLSARWSANEQAQQHGTVSNADYLLEKNKVIDALLAILHPLPEESIAEHLPSNLVPITSELEGPVSSKPSDFWKKFGYVGLLVGILAGVVKIVEYFQKPPATEKTEQPAVKADSLITPPNISTSGHQSPAVNAPGGDVQIKYDSEPASPTRSAMSWQAYRA